MLPIAYMIANLQTKNCVALIKRVKVHIICIDVSGSVIIDDYCTACGAVRLTVAVWHDTFEPCRIFGDIVDRCEVHAFAANCI